MANIGGAGIAPSAKVQKGSVKDGFGVVAMCANPATGAGKRARIRD
jgi:hypothetical protein